MKKILVLALIGIMMFSMTAWGAAPATSPDAKEAPEETVAEAVKAAETAVEDTVEAAVEAAAESDLEALASPAEESIAIVELTIDGKQVEATVMEDGEGNYTVTYVDEDGEHSFSGGGMAEDADGTMRPITLEEYIEYLQTETEEIEYDDDTPENAYSFEDIIGSINESGYDILALFDQIADLVEIFVNDGETETVGNIIRAVGELVNTIIKGDDTGSASSALARDLILDEDSLSQMSTGSILDIYEACRDELIQRGISVEE